MKRVLVVDDEEDILQLFTELLQRWGYEAVTARNGVEALDKFRTQQIDLIVSDLKMPEMDGLELLQRIRSIDSRVPVLVLTGYPTVETAVKAIQEGAFDYLMKPVNPEELRFRIEKALAQSEQKKSISFLKGLNWALIISIPVWLLLGILLAKALR
ncbi:MAG TPA: sigma-54-dependent Fis family transcriptional regulator [Bacteroidetes bacterium]|nr:sigma-54-dependent Fis family transcriptional regulator [Bacteroidota bacterium]